MIKQEKLKPPPLIKCKNALKLVPTGPFRQHRYSVWKVEISVDLVEVVLAEDTKDYTTLNLVNAEESFGNADWLKAEKAVVVVRQKSDLILWQKFLARAKKQQELERKKWAEPIRVLPPAK